MNILLTNDDGYDAAGLAAAYKALAPLGRVHVVAPQVEHSSCSHSISLHRPISVERITHPQLGLVYAVDGTPADCVRLAVAELVTEPIDLVIAGINHGANLGVDTFYSGTIAGAREAAMLGIPAMAISQATRRGMETDWDAATAISSELITRLRDERLPGPGLWSINLPAPIPPDPWKHIHRVAVDLEPVPPVFERTAQSDGQAVEFRYGKFYWDRHVAEPTDFSVVRDGGISITAIPLRATFPE